MFQIEPITFSNFGHFYTLLVKMLYLNLETLNDRKLIIHLFFSYLRQRKFQTVISTFKIVRAVRPFINWTFLVNLNGPGLTLRANSKSNKITDLTTHRPKQSTSMRRLRPIIINRWTSRP